MSDKTHASRITSYKNAVMGTSNDLRRKRQELSVALRRQARDEQLLKRRALSPEADDEDVSQVDERIPTPEEILQGLKSPELSVQLISARAARRMLSKEQNPPISVMVQAGVIKPLVDALDRDDCSELQFEAAWALTNIASGTHEHTMAVVDGGAVPKLVVLLAKGGNVGEQSAWALGNIAGDGPHTRDIVLNHGALPALIPSLSPIAPAAQLRTAVWTYSNLCRNKNPLVDFELVAPALPYISELLAVSDADVLADACWALSYLTDGPNERIEKVQSTPKLLDNLVKLLEHPAASVKTPALRALGNMVTGSDEQTDRCINAQAIPALNKLIQCEKQSLVKESCWAISNILAGTPAQIQAVVDGGALPLLAKVAATGDPRSQKEAAWGITNLCLGGSAAQLDALFASNFLEPYCDLLAATDVRTVNVVLEGITNLLQAADKYGHIEPMCVQLEEIGALDKIESLQNHDNEQVYKKSLHIIEKYFSEKDEVTTQPKEENGQYQFGTTAQNIQF